MGAGISKLYKQDTWLESFAANISLYGINYFSILNSEGRKSILQFSLQL